MERKEQEWKEEFRRRAIGVLRSIPRGRARMEDRRLLERLRRLRFLRQGSPILRRAVAGWHIEGPFLSDKPGFAGAHQASAMTDPSPARVRELRRAAGKDRLLLTLAPERKGALESIAEARRLGIQVSLGHTDASAERIEAAIQTNQERSKSPKSRAKA